MKFVDLFSHFNNIDEITKNATTTLLFATTSFRMINFYWNRMRYINIIKTVDDELRQMEKVHDEEIREIISSSIKYQRKLTASFWIIALITGNLMCVYSAVQSFSCHTGEALPSILQSWFPFEASCDNFWIIYAIQYYVMNIGMVIIDLCFDFNPF